MIVKNICGGYPGGFKLNNISFNIDRGKVYALLGLNGSGKTTIMKMVLGLIGVESGEIKVDGLNILSLKERERARLISYVPQASNIPLDILVLDVVLMGISPYLKLFEAPKQKEIKKAYDSLEMLNLRSLAYSNYQVLSGGLKRMVIIARALLQNSRYMVLDEPDCSLDLPNRNILMRRVRYITRKFDKGCIISMHDPQYALNYCDNILLIKNGILDEIDLEEEDIKLVELELSEVYGNIEIVKYKNRYMVYYE